MPYHPGFRLQPTTLIRLAFLAVLTNRFKLIQEFYKWQKPPFVLQ